MANPASSADVRSSQEIASEIATAIAERRLPPGAKLKEEALARLYSVSRTKIRAALLMLSKDELIEIIPEKGACVSRLSEREALEIFAVRRILEAALAREFVEKADEADYRRIEEHLVEERKALASNDTQLRTRLLGDFHVLLAEIAGNQVLLNILRKLMARTALAAMQSQSDHAAACSSDEHKLFIEAAKTGNADRAADLMLRHLDHVKEALRTNYSETGRQKDLVRALLV
ncbi:GntR family transcriptional regulator [Noviherbaspirillum sp. Root189]|uniref:GntR family transcriptional regulator n=1 Tax=Noviherbaspirillum sp. Root189 TaxID=1736487 RepID=UPI00070DD800|nr:GntR family transcriptional regulator [Noviherbaspirillum sp. Root189]KRB85180.1 GntR family transcriptional regulator [Noviherbaspirillum sp. Root189]